MRDKAYEQEIELTQQEMILVLDELHDDLGSWKARDILAAQRALQVLIESMIGLSRYVYLISFGVKVGRSREGLDGLAKRGALPKADYELAMKMVGFRNVLVHDYLDVNRKVIESIVSKKSYLDIQRMSQDLSSRL
ncbi:hypothetical protein EOPP23_11010 [Endozoicomonas sp. OPT23]|uniref:type VII toxin-antitoxin system HepT family RNase toxin n=1 Tax=Endozoicomonas sp. OPT23 TaxID=2072845 RepID=UPI00129B8988|nr:HepT-like ribonuclease domain-containing protein [Endozoicomonas sp. OPT23]MRI33515.1 hypothetical protein [Endozoicomonas sp. OPT23]